MTLRDRALIAQHHYGAGLICKNGEAGISGKRINISDLISLRKNLTQGNSRYENPILWARVIGLEMSLFGIV